MHINQATADVEAIERSLFCSVLNPTILQTYTFEKEGINDENCIPFSFYICDMDKQTHKYTLGHSVVSRSLYILTGTDERNLA